MSAVDEYEVHKGDMTLQEMHRADAAIAEGKAENERLLGSVEILREALKNQRDETCEHPKTLLNCVTRQRVAVVENAQLEAELVGVEETHRRRLCLLLGDRDKAERERDALRTVLENIAEEVIDFVDAARNGCEG